MSLAHDLSRLAAIFLIAAGLAYALGVKVEVPSPWTNGRRLALGRGNLEPVRVSRGRRV